MSKLFYQKTKKELPKTLEADEVSFLKHSKLFQSLYDTNPQPNMLTTSIIYLYSAWKNK